MESPDTIRLARTTAIALSLALSGYSFSASHINVSKLLSLPVSKSSPIFASVFHGGGQVMVPGALTSFSASMYLAYVIPAERTSWVVAGLSTVAVLPFTALFMLPGIQRVLKVAESSEAERELVKEDECKELMRKWVGQNYLRALLLLTGGMTGLLRTVV